MFRNTKLEGPLNVIAVLLFPILCVGAGYYELPVIVRAAMPLILGFAFANISGDIRDLGRRLVANTDQDGVKSANLFTFLWLGMTAALYFCAFYEAG